MKTHIVISILSLIVIFTSIMLTGCKQKNSDILQEAISNASTVEQGRIIIEIDANIQFDPTSLTEKELIEIAQYEHVQTKIDLQILDKQQTAIDMIVHFGATSLQTEIFKLEKVTYIKMPISNLYIELQQADFLQDMIKGVNLQEELLYSMDTNKDELAKYWFSLMQGDIDESGQKSILTPLGTEDVLYISQSVEKEKLYAAFDFLHSRSPILNEFLSAHQTEFSFNTVAKVETNIAKNHNMYKQVLSITGVHSDEKVNEYIFFPIKEYSITVTMDYSQLGDKQTIKLPKITQENTITREIFYRILNQLLP